VKIQDITREQLVAAVEAGVRAALDAGQIDFPEAARLRDYSREVTGLVGVGAFTQHLADGQLCECPVAAVGLYTSMIAHPSAFTRAYDGYMDDHVLGNDSDVEIVRVVA
jgi:hypothetical protein